MANARREHPFVDTTGAVTETVFRQQVDAALQRLARLIAANTTGDAALDNRVTELEDAGAGLALSASAPVDVTGAAASAGTGTDASRDDHRHDINVTAVLDTLDNTRGTILSRGAATWVGIDPGTATYVLTSNGVGSDPTYQVLPAGLTQEQVEDYVAGLIDDTATIAWTYVDGSGSLTASLVANGVSDTILRDSAALSVIGRSANSTGDPADIVAGTQGHVLHRTATPTVAFGTLIAGAFTTAPGIVTPAMLDNGTARTILGRSANSAGARADISGAGTAAVYQVASDDGTTVAFRSSVVIVDNGHTFYDVDFASLANNTLTAGTETIDGLSWTVAGDTFLGTFDILNGTGLRMIAGNSLGTHSTFTSATQDAPYLYLPLSSIPNWNGTSDLIVELYIPTLTLEAANEYVFTAIWVASGPHSTSIQRVRKFTWINVAGNIVPSVTSQTAQTNGTEVRAGQTIMSARWRVDGQFYGSWSTYSGGWVRPSTTIQGITSTAIVDPMLRDDARIVIGMGVLNDASATTAATVQRMRIRSA